MILPRLLVQAEGFNELQEPIKQLLLLHAFVITRIDDRSANEDIADA